MSRRGHRGMPEGRTTETDSLNVKESEYGKISESYY
jgi:hypothetical protein